MSSRYFVFPASFLLLAAPVLAQRLTPVDPSIHSVRVTDFSDEAAFIKRFGVKPKGEFETTAQFADRIAKAITPAHYLLRTGEPGTMAACAPDITYDADAETLRYELPRSIALTGKTGVAVYCQADDAGTYVAHNAMGASIRVTKISEVKLLLNAEGTDDSFLDGEMRMTANQAKAIKPFLRLGVIVRVGLDADGLPLVVDDGHSDPEFNSPYDITEKAIIAHASYLDAVLYDSRNGNVLARASSKAATARVQSDLDKPPAGYRCFAELPIADRQRIRGKVSDLRVAGQTDSIGTYLSRGERVTTAGHCGDSPENPFKPSP